MNKVSIGWYKYYSLFSDEHIYLYVYQINGDIIYYRVYNKELICYASTFLQLYKRTYFYEIRERLYE